jgi:beta-glucosidase
MTGVHEPGAAPAVDAEALGALAADFRFGAATAAFQIEGAVHEDGRGESIWDRFTHTPGRVENGDHGDVACDHYHRWREDVELIGALGLDSYRFSIAWPRIFPTGDGAPNQAGIDFYRRLAEGLRAQGVEPLATLYHWDLPQALQDRGGWGERETVERFGEYAETVYERLGDVIGEWLTINEPWVVAFAGHARGTKAPGITDWAVAVRASHHVNLAHGRAVEALRAARPGARVGAALHIDPIDPATDSDADHAAAERLDGHLNRWFLDALIRGRYPADMLDLYERRVGPLRFIRDGDLATIAAPTDFLGINYYRPFRVRAAERDAVLGAEYEAPHPPVTGMDWEVRPNRLTELLARIRNGYGNPCLYITENGAAYDDPPARNGEVEDPERTEYLRSHLAAVAEAAAAGSNVRGYYVWSLLDNFEWEHGYDKRFGIVHVDYRTQRRTPKASARWYRDLIRAAHTRRK